VERRLASSLSIPLLTAMAGDSKPSTTLSSLLGWGLPPRPVLLLPYLSRIHPGAAGGDPEW